MPGWAGASRPALPNESVRPSKWNWQVAHPSNPGRLRFCGCPIFRDVCERWSSSLRARSYFPEPGAICIDGFCAGAPPVRPTQKQFRNHRPTLIHNSCRNKLVGKTTDTKTPMPPTPFPEPHWGTPPWKIDFTPPPAPVPASVDIAIIGAGFTGLAAAAWLRHLAPEKSVAVFEAGRIGAGASGRTGGMALAETAAGDIRGLGDVLAGLQRILGDLGVDCDLALPGAWEIGRGRALKTSAIDWKDSGRLRVVKKVPGGTLDPGKLVAGLARAASARGATIFENHRVVKVDWNAGGNLGGSGV